VRTVFVIPSPLASCALSKSLSGTSTVIFRAIFVTCNSTILYTGIKYGVMTGNDWREEPDMTQRCDHNPSGGERYGRYGIYEGTND